ncbi:predicted protein [Histoplasma mississippiense (nom. inval.)]|uniref:predicted protein n=1 Tax=Ajellomyces capsulatus (strain NAm1 / WU24) TaxID=2059318 RepID=UPI000157C4BC|nr:predicted protein [Histoplasma mississippiense (nom. inval.)]EDN08503.1 predicted protein [Histoplasma mississippiense (nom. inval.)]
MQILYKNLSTATMENDSLYILWIKHQFDCETKVIRIDNERAIKESDIFKDWVIELGLEIEYSSEYIHEQNGAAERADIEHTLRFSMRSSIEIGHKSSIPELISDIL